MRSKHIICLLIAILLGLTNLKAQTWEIWGGSNGPQTIGNVTHNTRDTKIILIEGNVTITGTITVDNSSTLRIVNLSGREYTIKNGVNGDRTTPLFKVIGGSKLAFNYTDQGFNLRKSDNTIYKVLENDGAWSNMTEAKFSKYAPITLDGGSIWAKNSQGEEWYEEEVGNGAKKWVLSATNKMRFTDNASMIESIGALEFFRVNIRNFYASDNFGKGGNTHSGVFGIASSHIFGTDTNLYQYRYTHLKYCLVEKCKSRTGVFLNIGNSNNLNVGSYPPDHADRRIVVENCTIRNCVVFGDKDGWGGIIRCKGGSVHLLQLKNTTFDTNFSHGDGAGLWWNAGGHSSTKCTIDGCTFKNNRAMRNAGGMRMETIFEFTGNKTVVTGNECYGLLRNAETTYIDAPEDNGNGAGIHIFGYASDMYHVGGGLITYNLSNKLEVSDNYAAGQGGGIAFDFTAATKLLAGTRITANFSGMTVKNNRAGMDGGGIYFNNTTSADRNYIFNIYLNSGTITGNEAHRGGGISTSNVNVSFESANSNLVTLSENKATAGSGGGIYICDGNISLDKVNVTNNSSLYEDIADNEIYGGGGVYVQNGSFAIQSGSIANNSSGMYGGGVFVYNADAGSNGTIATNDVHLSGGDITKNNALYGGGLAAYGDLDLTIQNIDIENNTALNGGGILMKGIANGPAKLDYQSGIIRYNRANAKNGQTLNTAYNLDYKTISGMGGGFYVGEYAQLSFAQPQNFGIYSNIAENGADDLFGYHSNVKITLPDVQKLNLDGYEGGSISNLFWSEDYITNDTNYDKGLKLKGNAWNTDRTNQRVRDVLREKEGEYYCIEFGEYESSKVYQNKYLSLTLIWHEDYLLLVKKGMKSGENAIFNIYRLEGGIENLYVTVMLTDADKDVNGNRTKKITLKHAGTYKVVELPWAWAYDVDQQQQQKLLGQNNSEEERTFTFTNTPKESAPIHDESLKVNHM